MGAHARSRTASCLEDCGRRAWGDRRGFPPFPPPPHVDREGLKRQAGEAAAALATSGMVVGLGTGSTVRYTIESLGRRVGQGLEITGIPTSKASEELARRVGIPVSTLDEHARVDLTIDGADEVGPGLALIKGGGGALTREKVVARVSRRMVAVADAAKVVAELGTTFPVPIEVVAFARRPLIEFARSLGAAPTLRADASGKPFVTDNGNLIVDAKWPRILDAHGLEAQLESFPGVVACGLFLGLCKAAYIAEPSGVRILTH
jgi:ribose 5-phosphate isomerase A